MAAGKSRRYPPELPEISAQDWPQARGPVHRLLKWVSQSLYNSIPAPHQATHLVGGSDALQAPGTPLSVDVNQAASIGVGPSLAREDHRHAVVTPLTTKGDLLVFNGSAYARLAAGTDYRYLVALAAASAGLSYFTPPLCFVNGTGAQSLNSGAFTTINWDASLFDPGGLHSNVVNNSRITVQVPGNYLAIAVLNFAANALGNRGIKVAKNGGAGIEIAKVLAAGAGDSTILLGIDVFPGMLANDFIEMQGLQTSGGALNVNVNLSGFALLFVGAS